MKATKNSEAGMVLRVLLLVMVTVSFAVDAWAQAGYVHASPGEVTIQNAAGAWVPLEVGAQIAPGAAIRTAGAAGTVLKFADGLVITLSPNSSLRISAYQFDPNNASASRVSIDLLDGGMRFVAGAIAEVNPAALRVSVGANVIAPQTAGGLDFSAAIAAAGAPNGVVIAVNSGEIALRSSSGAAVAIGPSQVVNLRPGQTTATPIPLAAAPAAIQAEMAALRSVALPSNAPVAIAPAARAAAAVASAARVQAAAAASPENTQLQAAARSAADLASSALQATAAATENLVAAIVEARLAALPATAAGPVEAAAPAQPVAEPQRTLPDVPQFVALAPIPAVVASPGVGGTCVGSPC